LESEASQRVRGIQPYLFVYGTLKQGGKFHRELSKDRSVKFIGEARIRGMLYQIQNADYPGAVPTRRPNQYVTGQLFFMGQPQRTLAVLDEFEGVDEGLFRRELVEAKMNGKPLKAWAYFYDRPLEDSNLLPVGVYSSE
jgi:gamma-glutamylcyclotransferase (GGCT)/AIG2-like uncharacterized protein YtfP